MKWIDDRLGPLPDMPRKGQGIDLDQTPAIPMWWEAHEMSKGGVRGSVHDKLNQAAGGKITKKRLNELFPDPTGQRAEVSVFLDDLSDAYRHELNMPGIALGFRKWFSDRGI